MQTTLDRADDFGHRQLPGTIVSKTIDFGTLLLGTLLLGTAQGHDGGVDDAERDALIAKVSSEFARVVALARAGRAVRGPDDEHAQWLDRLIAGLQPLAEGAHDLETLGAVRRLMQRHGPGPWPIEDLAAMTDRDLESMRRVLAGLTQAGLAAPTAADS